MPGPRISTDADEQDIELIHRFLSQESKWARGIPIETVRRSMRNSLNFGLFIGPSQVGYARVISDQATFAYLLDVFVLPEQRGKGYGRRLVEAVLAHPGLQGLRRIALHTSHAHGLYEKFGFARPAKPDTCMELAVAQTYRQ